MSLEGNFDEIPLKSYELELLAIEWCYFAGLFAEIEGIQRQIQAHHPYESAHWGEAVSLSSKWHTLTRTGMQLGTFYQQAKLVTQHLMTTTFSEMSLSLFVVLQHENCNRAFARSENRKIHMRSHTGDKPFNCKYAQEFKCYKKFSNSSDRAKHEQTHKDPVSSQNSRHF